MLGMFRPGFVRQLYYDASRDNVFMCYVPAVGQTRPALQPFYRKFSQCVSRTDNVKLIELVYSPPKKAGKCTADGLHTVVTCKHSSLTPT